MHRSFPEIRSCARSRGQFLLPLAILLFALPPSSALAQKGEDKALAEWIGLGRNETFRAYLDQRSVQRKGELARVYQLTDFATAQWVDERTVMGSMRALVEYDCSLPRSRPLVLEAYSEQMGEGSLVAKEEKPDSEWEEIVPGSPGENVRRLVCRK